MRLLCSTRVKSGEKFLRTGVRLPLPPVFQKTLRTMKQFEGIIIDSITGYEKTGLELPLSKEARIAINRTIQDLKEKAKKLDIEFFLYECPDNHHFPEPKEGGLQRYAQTSVESL